MISLGIFLLLFTVQASAGGCDFALNSTKAVLDCVDRVSPEIQQARLEYERTKHQIDAAGKWTNPELALNSVSGKTGSETSRETDISLGIPVEIGGSIGARKKIAEGNAARADASFAEIRARMRGESLVKLHRLRQLNHELEVVDESIQSFTKLVTQFSRRPRLSPEQETSSSVYKMAKSEYELKKAELQDELAELNTFFVLNAGVTGDSLKNALPPSVINWPGVQESGNPEKAPKVRSAEAALVSAQGEKDLASGEAWPTITVGPSVKLQKEGARSDTFYGFNVSLPLPLFNLNGGARAAASAGLASSELQKETALLAHSRERQELSKIYSQSVQLLGSTLSHKEIERAHSEVEKLFSRGVVPSSLVIEAHRSYLELEKTRNERERKALTTLMQIYTLDGNLMEKSL